VPKALRHRSLRRRQAQFLPGQSSKLQQPPVGRAGVEDEGQMKSDNTKRGHNDFTFDWDFDYHCRRRDLLLGD
jgi:hypothetical protein